jgi:hypothetical protein
MGVIQTFFEKLIGLDKIKAQAIAEAVESIQVAKQAAAAADDATEAAKSAIEAERLAKLSPKELATEKKEPWVAVLETHVNKENVRNGFFELDWNEYFVVQLKTAGYTGTTDEEIVDQWFQELCRNVGDDSGINMDRRGAGFINVNNLGNGKSEVS